MKKFLILPVFILSPLYLSSCFSLPSDVKISPILREEKKDPVKPPVEKPKPPVPEKPEPPVYNQPSTEDPVANTGSSQDAWSTWTWAEVQTSTWEALTESWSNLNNGTWETVENENSWTWEVLEEVLTWTGSSWTGNASTWELLK